MDKKTITIGIAVIAVSVALGIILAGQWTEKAPASLGGAGSGWAALNGTSSPMTLIAGQVYTLFATSTDSRCSSRVITTGNGELNLTFGEYNRPNVPTATFGHKQYASSTESYDGEIFGCGTVKAYAVSNVTLTISEF